MNLTSRELTALEDLVDGLLYETHDNVDELARVKIRELAVKLEELVRKLVEKS